jgi:hypothetical protein
MSEVLLPPEGARDLAFWVDRLIQNGWLPSPVCYGEKRPIAGSWNHRRFAGRDFVRLLKKHRRLGIAFRLDDLVAIDIDEDDEDRAAALEEMAIATLGPTPAVRIGRYPRRALIYRARDSMMTSRCAEAKLEIRAGQGHQLVAFNLHRDTGMPYAWPCESPLVLSVGDLPNVNEDQIGEFLRTIGIGDEQPKAGLPLPHIRMSARVSDGRDRLLRDLVAAEIGKWKARGWALERDSIARGVWQRFSREADLTRPKGAGGVWCVADVQRKLDYALRPIRAHRIRAAVGGGKFWTLNRKFAFKGLLELDSRLSGADRSVGWEMIQAVRDERGLSYLAARTIAEGAGVHETTANMSRQKLIRLGYFVEIDTPIRGISGAGRRPVVCSPNQKLLEPVSDADAIAVAA